MSDSPRKYRSSKRQIGGPNAPQPQEIAAVKNLAPQIANLRSNIGLLGKAFNVRTQTGFRFAHIVLSLKQHLERLRSDDTDGHGEVDRTPGGKYKLPACLLRKFRSDQPSLNNRKKAMPKILIVDDNRIHLACATYSLRKHFLPENVFVATNGREALEIMEHVVIDAIFVDTKMPTMDGLEMADVVRHVEMQMGQREFKTLIVGMLTPAEARDEDLLTDCLVAGMDRFCIKPLSIQMYAILDAVTVSGSAVEGFRRKALELQWISRHSELQQTLFGKQSNTTFRNQNPENNNNNNSSDDNNNENSFSNSANNNNNSTSPLSSSISTATTAVPSTNQQQQQQQKRNKDAGGRSSQSPASRSLVVIGANETESFSTSDTNTNNINNNNNYNPMSNRVRQLLNADVEDMRRAQETALTLAPDLHDERKILQLVEKDQRHSIEDIFARERREDTERMQHASSLLRDRIADLERQLAVATGEKQKTMESLHIETIARLEKQAEEQRLQIMKLSVRNRELTHRNEKLEEDMRQIIRHGANNARTLRTAFRFIGQVQRKMERYEQHSMMMEDRSANLSWQNFFGSHFQGTCARKQLEMPAAAEDFSSSWYHEQLEESHRIAARSNESCASAVVLLGELLDHVQLVRPEMFGLPGGQNTPVIASTPPVTPPIGASHNQNNIENNNNQDTTLITQQQQQQQQSAWKTLQRDIESVVHSLSTLLMQNIRDLNEGTKRNAANVVVRELDLWKRLARFDRTDVEDPSSNWLDVPSAVQDEIHAIVERMKIVQMATQRRSNTTQTEAFEAPPWVTSDMGSEFAALDARRPSGTGSELSFMTEVSLGANSKVSMMAAQAANAKDWTFTGLLNKLRPIISFEGFVPLDVRQRAFEKIVESVFRLERKQTGDLGDATKRLIREVRTHYSAVETGDEKRRVLLLGDTTSKSALQFREILKILNNVTDNMSGVVDAVIVHTLKSIEPSGASSRATKERGLALALLEALESADIEQPIFTPWGEPALVHKVRSGETWEGLEKSFGCSLVEMKRMNATADPPIDFEASPEPGAVLKLPARPDYIRGKFAHLYHPKTTFSKSGTGERNATTNNNSKSGGMLSNRSSNNLLGGNNNNNNNNATGGGRRSHSSLNQNMFTAPKSSSNNNYNSNRGSGFLGVNNGPSGRNSSMFNVQRQGTMKMTASRVPSRLQSTRAPSQLHTFNNNAKRRASFTGETISHFKQQETRVGATNRERVNARVAQSVLMMNGANKNNTNNNNNKNSSSSPGEINLSIPVGSTETSPSGSPVLTSQQQKQPANTSSSFNVSVKVLPTEAPKRLSEFAEEFGITEQELRDANPQLISKLNDNNSPDHALNADDEIQIPVKKEFVMQSLAEARDSQLSEAMKKFLEAAAAKQEADDELRKESSNPSLEKNNSEKFERSRSKAQLAAAAAQESQLAADHAAALHRALMNHLDNLESGGGSGGGNDDLDKFDQLQQQKNNNNNNNINDPSPSPSSPTPSNALTSTSNPFNGIRTDSLRKTKLQRVVVDMPVKEATSFEKLAQLYGIRGEDLVEANPLLSNPIAAGATLKVPVNIEEWRDRVAKAAIDARVAAELGTVVPITNVDSILVVGSEDGEDGDDFSQSIPGMRSQGSASIRYGKKNHLHQHLINNGDGNDINNISNINNLNQSGGGGNVYDEVTQRLIDGTAEEAENAWSRSDKALFNSVTAALKQRSLTVVVTHNETEYGVTLDTIAEEYGCGQVMFVEEDYFASQEKKDNDAEDGEKKLTKDDSSLVINNNNKQTQPPPLFAVPKSTTTNEIATTTSPSISKEASQVIIPETVTNNNKNNGIVKRESSLNSVSSSIRQQKAIATLTTNAIHLAAVEIEKLNKDTGAVIRDDDDDNSVNPNIPLLVPVPLEAILKREIDFVMELQSRSVEMTHALRRQAQDSSGTPEEVFANSNIIGGGGTLANNGRAGSLSQFTVGSNQNINNNNNNGENVIRKTSNITSHHSNPVSVNDVKGAVAELCQLQDMLSRHQEIIATLVDIYFSGIREKMRKPASSEISTMTDNISNILFASGNLRRLSNLQHHQQSGSSNIRYDKELLAQESLLIKQEEDERQLAAAAVLLGVDSIHQVPAALKNARFSNVATAFLERLKKTYPVAAAHHEKMMAGSSPSSTRKYQNKNIHQGKSVAILSFGTGVTSNLAEQGIEGSNSFFEASSRQVGNNAYYNRLFGITEHNNNKGKSGGGGVSFTNFDSLKIVGSKAGTDDGGANKSGMMRDDDDFVEYGTPRKLGTSFISAYASINNNNNNSYGSFDPTTSQIVNRSRKPVGVKSTSSNDLLRQRMQRLGFRTSAEALYGDASVLAKFHDNGSPLVDEMLRVHGKRNHQANANANDDDEEENENENDRRNLSRLNRAQQRRRREELLNQLDDEEEERAGKYDTAAIIQKAARQYGASTNNNNEMMIMKKINNNPQKLVAEQMWAGSSTISGRSNNNNNNNNIFSKSTPLPNKFHRTPNYTTENRNDDDDNNNNQKILSPVPPSTLGISSSTFAKSPRIPQQQQQQSANPLASSTTWEQRKSALANSTIGERKVEMYAEDRKGAIERFTSRLLEIIDDSPQNQAKHSPTKKFSSSPTSLAGGGGFGGGGGANSSVRVSPGRSMNFSSSARVTNTTNNNNNNNLSAKPSGTFARSAIVVNK